MNTIKNIVVGFALLVSLLAMLETTQAAETVKHLQAVSFHTSTKDAVAYYLADKGTCKVAVTLSDKVAYVPARFEEAVQAHKSTLHQIDDGNALELTCQADAQTMTINILTTVAQH
jgi:hypothetical protein